MQKVIEVLDEIYKRNIKDRDFYRRIMGDWQDRLKNNLPEDSIIIADLAKQDSNIEQFQAAIQHLQRPKIKKDPRADGLPGVNQIVLVWPSDGCFASFGLGYYQANETWRMCDDDWGLDIPTDDILFYCDPNDII